MVKPSLAEIRARLQAQENKQGGNTSGGDNAIYPHWNMAEGSNTALRFLPDDNPENTFFWAERAMIKLPFAGVKGEMDSKSVIVQVPCVEMWNETCPILQEVRTWFKDSSLEEMGRRYWKKRSYIFQGFVRENALADDETPENPIRRFIIGPQIFQIIKAALMDPDLEELPTDYENGLDFRITKTSKGGYADYSTSKWARKESPLTEQELAAIEQHGLYNLNDFLPKKPTDVELKVMVEMFEASVDGQSFDMERWGQYYRPAGMSAPAKSSAVTATAAPKSVPLPETTVKDDVPFETTATAAAEPVETPSGGGSQSAQDILAKIRSRQSS